MGSWMPTTNHLSAEECLEITAGTDLKHYVPNPDLFPGFFQPVFAHLCAGHRRPGDVQACIEELDWSPSDIVTEPVGSSVSG